MEDKEKLLEKEVVLEGNSDKSMRAKFECRASLPDIKIKEELWNMFINNPAKESLYNLKAYMSGFCQINQIELIKQILTEKYLEDIYKISNQDFFYINAFN